MNYELIVDDGVRGKITFADVSELDVEVVNERLQDKYQRAVIGMIPSQETEFDRRFWN